MYCVWLMFRLKILFNQKGVVGGLEGTGRGGGVQRGNGGGRKR